MTPLCELCGQPAVVFLQWDIKHGQEITSFDPPVACCNPCSVMLTERAKHYYDGLKIEFTLRTPEERRVDLQTSVDDTEQQR